MAKKKKRPKKVRVKLRPEVRGCGLFQFAEFKAPGACPVKFCQNLSAGYKGKLCHKHLQQLWRHRHPLKAKFHNLRSKARARGIAFCLSYEHFKQLVEEGGHDISSQDRHGDTISVDRVNPSLPYADGNVQLITVSENVRKGNRERYACRKWQPEPDEGEREEIQDEEVPF